MRFITFSLITLPQNKINIAPRFKNHAQPLQHFVWDSGRRRRHQPSPGIPSHMQLDE